MTVDYAYNYIQFIARKNQIVQIKPAEFNFAINQAQRDYLDFLIGHVEQFRYNDATPRVALGMNNKISKDLVPFKVNNQSINVVNTIAPYPTNFYFLALMMDSNGKKIEWISDDKLPKRLNSSIDPFSDSGKSFYIDDVLGWKIYGNANPVFVNYYTLPNAITWAYTIVNNRPVYDPVNSAQPLWNDACMEEILKRTARILGFSFEANNLIQFGEHAIQSGE